MLEEIIPLPNCEKRIRFIEQCKTKECWEKCSQLPACPVELIEE